MHAHIVSSKPIQEARKGVPVHACGWNHAWLDYITCAWLWCMTCMECMNDSGLWPFWHLLLGWTGWQWCRPRCIFYLRRWWGRWPPCLGNGRWPGRWWNNSAGSWQIWYHLRSWRHELVGRRGTWPIPSSWAGYWTKGWDHSRILWRQRWRLGPGWTFGHLRLRWHRLRWHWHSRFCRISRHISHISSNSFWLSTA